MATTHAWRQEEPFALTRLHIDDRCILRDVRAVLAGILGIAARNVVVIVRDGEVMLAGRIHERWMKLEVEHDCLQVEGVRSVVTRLI
jgi:osmotically-inducible protein OsmY